MGGKRGKRNAHSVRVSHGISAATTPSCRAGSKTVETRSTDRTVYFRASEDFGKGVRGRRRWGRL